eukprot:53321-Eustigmatos_ZCMA.PRE.1
MCKSVDGDCASLHAPLPSQPRSEIGADAGRETKAMQDKVAERKEFRGIWKSVMELGEWRELLRCACDFREPVCVHSSTATMSEVPALLFRCITVC